MKFDRLGSISFQQLETFIAIAEHKSFSAAADSLFVNQSVVSRTIQKMESLLGFPLFLRTNRGVMLTREGQALYLELKPALNSITDAIRRVQISADTEDDGTIRIGCLDALEVEEHLSGLVQEYQKTHPAARFHVASYNFRDLRECLMCDFLHCVFSLSIGFGALRNIETRRIAHLDTYFAVSSRLPLVNGSQFDLMNLRDIPLYLTSVAEMHDPEQRALKICRSYGFEPTSVHYVPSRYDAELAVKNNNGFSIDGPPFSKRFPSDITMLKIPDPPSVQYIIAAWHMNRCPRETREFLDSLPRIH